MTSETLSPDQTFGEWLNAMNDGNSTRAFELSKLNDDTKRWISSHTAAENALEDLKLAALLRLGDIGRNEIEQDVHLRLGTQQYCPAVAHGDTATIVTKGDSTKRVTFVHENGIWKLDLSGDWMNQGMAFELNTLAKCCRLEQLQKTECERIKKLLDGGQITSNFELKEELVISRRTMSEE